ncbi:DUF1801 domain-containing protein [Portibacter marinus]|uniref:DUF1801 domain-containing protein n=1 Tax=Portibacter marinus TaxID=2898660 RepID=UPI001F48F171|nr:DUF1801 domain-containing protein [Portibacter marinus]
MSKNKTQPNEASVKEFINDLEQEQRRIDALKSLDMYEQITGLPAKMWGGSIIGFGEYHYKYESGREGNFFKSGFSPRKNSMTYYIMSGFPEYKLLLQELGKHKTGKSCLYIKKLDDVNLDILNKIIAHSFNEMNKKYPD